MTDYADLEKRLEAKAHYVAAFPNAMHHQIAVPELLAEAIDAVRALTRDLEEAKEALKPFADAANTLDMEDIEGFPFDDPREVLWAGEGGTITVAEFRRAQALVTRLSRARSDSTETEAPAE